MLYNLSGICSKEKAFGNPVDLLIINGVYTMTKSIANEVTITKSTVTGQPLLTDADIAYQALPPVNTLESQGKALHTAWKRIVKAEKKQIVAFDLPLGKLMMSLAAEAGGNIKKERLQDCDIHNIPKQRRSEAKQLAELWDNLQDYLDRFTSTSAMLKAYKADNKAPVEPEAEQQVEAKTTEGKTSDVGQTESTMDATDIATEVFSMLDKHNVSLVDFKEQFAAVCEIMETEDTNKKAVA